jgi:tripartite-type tricarboxylate transporter receptor subunit TctC
MHFNLDRHQSAPRWLLLAMLFISASVTATAQAQTWPTKPIRIVVGYPAGGLADIMGRLVAQQLTETLGQAVVIENKGGANGNLAADAVAKSPPDGYTFALYSTALESVNPFLFKKMPFDPQKDLVPVAATGRIQLFLVTKASLPPNEVKAFVSHARSSKPPLSYGSPGPGSSPHLVGELFKQRTGVEAVHIPYKGAAPALQDLLGGQIDFLFDPGISFSHVRTGTLKMLAVASAKRSDLFPEVPTLEEVGYKGLDYDTWFGIYAPARTPSEIIQRLNQEVNKALAKESVRNRLKELGGEATPMPPGELRAIAEREAGVFGPLIKELNINAD